MFSRAVIILLLLSLIAGYTESQSRLLADPAACPQYKCRTLHAYWAGNADYVSAYHVKDEDGNADNGSENTFTLTSVENPPLQKTDTTIDYWKYPTCTPFCGKDAAGKWQATQEVLKSGTKVPNSKLNVPRQPCTATEKGRTGETNANPTNANATNGNTPPTAPPNG